jgi:lysophospholipase L1-like esterase
MPHQFFARFNLQRFGAELPADAALLAAAGGGDTAEMQGYLDTFAATNAQRATALIDRYRTALEPLRGKRVFFLGDSITSDNLGYRPLVTAAAGLSAFDGAVSGCTSSSQFTYCRRLLLQQRPDMVSIMLGSNDAVSIERTEQHQVSPEEYARNMTAIVGWAVHSGAQVLLMELPPIHEARFVSAFAPQDKLHSNPAVALYNAILRDVAQMYSLTPVSMRDLLNKQDSLFEPDGVHPSIEGHDIIADKWLQAAITLYRGESA